MTYRHPYVGLEFFIEVFNANHSGGERVLRSILTLALSSVKRDQVPCGVTFPQV